LHKNKNIIPIKYLMKLQNKKLIDCYFGGFLMFAMKPVVILLGFILRRDHALNVQGNICFIKMLGCGSLVVAHPTIFGLRKRYPSSKFILISTNSIKESAQTLGVFDRIDSIDDSSLFRLVVTAFACIIKNYKIDTVIDLEVYSRLTTVFSILTCARNRIGFYLESVFWRKYLNTHLIFFQRFSPTYYWYDAIAHLLDAQPASIRECREKISQAINLNRTEEGGNRRIAIGHGCSGLSRERMLTAEQWLSFFEKYGCLQDGTELIFLGTMSEHALADNIVKEVSVKFPNARFNNYCGQLSLIKSLCTLASCSEFLGIDSALLHYARFMGLKCTSFWGPTEPSTLLRPIPDIEETVMYNKVPCSPCVHIAEKPPCNGKNICIQNLFKTNMHDSSAIWLINM